MCGYKGMFKIYEIFNCGHLKNTWNNMKIWHMICPIWKDLFHNQNDCKCTTDACGVVDFVICVMMKKRHELRSELLFLTVNTSKRNSPSSHHHHHHASDTKTHKNSSEWRVKNWFNRIHNFLFPFLNYKNPSRENK